MNIFKRENTKKILMEQLRAFQQARNEWQEHELMYTGQVHITARKSKEL
jgi:hypothetical protein